MHYRTSPNANEIIILLLDISDAQQVACSLSPTTKTEGSINLGIIIIIANTIDTIISSYNLVPKAMLDASSLSSLDPVIIQAQAMLNTMKRVNNSIGA